MPFDPPNPYAAAATDYLALGWPPLPVPPDTKFPPPTGRTGAAGTDPTETDVDVWRRTRGGYSVALRMPAVTDVVGREWLVLGLDVDTYAKGAVEKHGATTLGLLEQQLGPLPATWISSARPKPLSSGIRFYLVPPGRYANRLVAGGYSDVDVIQRHHRYAVVWPSPHPSTGGTYRWYAPWTDKSQPGPALSDRPPAADELPQLPAAWVEHLAAGATAARASAGDDDTASLLEALQADTRPMCADLASAAQRSRYALDAADAGSRHDTMVSRALEIACLGAEGHTGAATALEELTQAWAEATAGEGREAELTDAIFSAVSKPARQSTSPADDDPCAAVFIDLPPEGVETPVDAPRTSELVGTHLFDTKARHDQLVAEDMLVRLRPVLRYAADAGAWLRRGQDCWRLETGDKAPWVVTRLATLLPKGDPEAKRDEPGHSEAVFRGRMLSGAGSSGVEKKIRSLVADVEHPSALNLSELDADPDVFWAGGVCWDLRASRHVPTPAGVSLDAPHQRTARYTPRASQDTPLWDALIEAVWPDPGVRAWSLRVLSIALTGHADRALPVLLGPPGTGKSSVSALLLDLLGSYGTVGDTKLLSSRSNAHAVIFMELKGRRLVFVDEAPAESKAGQERLKMISGGAPLTAHRMRENPVTFEQTHTLVLTANDEPTLTDPAVRSRVRLLPCEGDPEAVKAARAAIGPTGGAVWRREAPGVLAAMMAEAAAWLADPSSALTDAAPESIRYRAEEIAHEQDPLSQWLAEEVVPDARGTRAAELYSGFRDFCLDQGVRRDQVPSVQAWGIALNARGHGKRRTAQGNYRLLRERDPDEAVFADVEVEGDA